MTLSMHSIYQSPTPIPDSLGNTRSFRAEGSSNSNADPPQPGRAAVWMYLQYLQVSYIRSLARTPRSPRSPETDWPTVACHRSLGKGSRWIDSSGERLMSSFDAAFALFGQDRVGSALFARCGAISPFIVLPCPHNLAVEVNLLRNNTFEGETYGVQDLGESLNELPLTWLPTSMSLGSSKLAVSS